jgi:hypothetical protein
VTAAADDQGGDLSAIEHGPCRESPAQFRRQ